MATLRLSAYEGGKRCPWQQIGDLNNVSVDLYENDKLDLSIKSFKIALRAISKVFNGKKTTSDKMDEIFTMLKNQINFADEVCKDAEKPSSKVCFDFFSQFTNGHSRKSMSTPLRIKKITPHTSVTKNIFYYSSTIMFNMSVVYEEKGMRREAQETIGEVRDMMLNNGYNNSVLMPSVSNILGMNALMQLEKNGGQSSASNREANNHLHSAMYSFKEGYHIAKKFLNDTTGQEECDIEYVTENLYRLLVNLGRVYYLLGNYNEAAIRCCEAMDMKRKYASDQHPDVCSLMYNLGLIHHKMKMFTEALNFYQYFLDHTSVDSEKFIPYRVTVLCKTILGQITKSIIDTGNDFTISNDIEKLCYFRDKFGHEYIEVAPLLHQVGMKLHEAKLEHYALPFFLEQLRVEKMYIGTKNMKLVEILMYIGKAYDAISIYTTSLEYFHQVLDLIKENKQEQSIFYSDALYHIGKIHFKKEQWYDAKTRFLECVDVIKNIHGNYDSSVADKLQDIGSLFLDIGMVRDAQCMFMEVLLIRRLNYGNNHALVSETLDKIGKIHDVLGEYKESINVYYESLKVKESQSNINNIDVAKTLQSLGQIHHATGELKHASKTYTRLITILAKELGYQHGIIGSIQNVLGIIYFEDGETELSRKSFMQSKATVDRWREERIRHPDSDTESKEELENKMWGLFGNTINDSVVRTAAAA